MPSFLLQQTLRDLRDRGVEFCLGVEDLVELFSRDGHSAMGIERKFGERGLRSLERSGWSTPGLPIFLSRAGRFGAAAKPVLGRDCGTFPESPDIIQAFGDPL